MPFLLTHSRKHHILNKFPKFSEIITISPTVLVWLTSVWCHNPWIHVNDAAPSSCFPKTSLLNITRNSEGTLPRASHTWKYRVTQSANNAPRKAPFPRGLYKQASTLYKEMGLDTGGDDKNSRNTEYLLEGWHALITLVTQACCPEENISTTFGWLWNSLFILWLSFL